MSESVKATPLYLHTLETLCDEIVSGRPILLDDNGSEFQLKSPEARSIFAWYRTNPGKWAKNVLKQDVEALADQIEKSPPELPKNIYSDQNQKSPKIHLKSVKAHRFAGIHKYGKPQQPPEDFYFDFEKPMTLIEGINGAGKTSLLSAITWCLTGHVYRSQRPPELTERNVDLEIVDDENSVSEKEFSHNMTVITPMPSAEVLKSLAGAPLLLDTWVELVFSNDDGQEIGTIKRSVQRSTRGKIVIDEPDFSKIGIDPIAREIGTKMPGLIPYIQLGVASDLGKAVAGLTGIKPLKDLAKHAEKSKAKLIKDLINDRNNEIAKFDSEFLKARSELSVIIKDNSNLDPKKSIPSPGADKTLENQLLKFKEFFEGLQTQALAEAKLILGDSFDHESQAARLDLMKNVGPALGLLDPSNLRRLPSASRLSKLASLSDEELLQAETAIGKILSEAKEITTIEEIPELAARLRLYAKIASWIKELPNQNHDIDTCPLCKKAIDGQLDDITGKFITDHIKEYLGIESGYLEKTIKTWEENAKAALSKKLPESLRTELNRDLPKGPKDLISAALSEELFESQLFQASLLPLKSVTQALCKKELESLKRFDEPEPFLVPDHLKKNKDSDLEIIIRRVSRAIAFARWRKNNDKECKDVFLRIIGTAKSDNEGVNTNSHSISNWSLSECLVALDRLVRGTTPLTESLHKVDRMTEQLSNRRQKENRIAIYGKTAEAITELLSIDELVELQVAYLINKLHSETLKWRSSFYLSASVDAPQVIETDVGSDGSLAIAAAAEGTKTSAQHISNSSDLRATLLALLIAFWQHLIEVRGGLSLLLIDDLQELFDKDNRRRVANTIPLIVQKGGRIIVTTNDSTFARRVAASVTSKIGSDNIDHRRIHPLNASRQHIELGKFMEAIEQKRRIFELPENSNEPQPARDYIKDLRIYLENQLVDFLDFSGISLPYRPTLSDLINSIRTRTRVPHEAFTSLAFKKLTSDPALVDNSAFLGLMNQSHHGNENEITFNDIWQVRDDCVRVRKIVDGAHEEYERWMRRDPRDPVKSMPAFPEPSSFPTFNVPIIMDLAAFTTDSPSTDVYEAEEKFSSSWFENCALYLINTHNFGFAAPLNSLAIVDLSNQPIIDRMLVVAIHQNKIYARRVLRNLTNPNVVVLASEAENPLKRPPTVFLPAEEVRLLNVIGIIFDDRPHYPRPSEEAELLDNINLSEDIKLVFKVRGDSAIPLALPGQTILGGSVILTSQLDTIEGTPVAISTSDGSAFKRIGKTIPGHPHVRQFESIGGLGESLLVRTEDIEDSFNSLPLLMSIRHVIGILYTMT